MSAKSRLGHIKDLQRAINECHRKNPHNFFKIPIALFTLANLCLG